VRASRVSRRTHAYTLRLRVGRFAHDEHVTVRLQTLEYLLANSNLALSRAHVDALWTVRESVRVA
jgi:hypothetical protein